MKNISRRSFLKFTASVLVVASTSISTVPTKTENNKYKNFEPQKQYGDYMYTTTWDKTDQKICLNILKQQIRSLIPVKYCTPKYITFTYKHVPRKSVLEPEHHLIGWKYSA